MIKFFEFLDGTQYCLARDIIDCARSQGYEPIISTDGRVHPGTICNNTLRLVIKDPGLRRKFAIVPESVVEVQNYNEHGNAYFIENLIRNSHINPNLVASGHVDFYSVNACEAVLSSLLKSDIKIIPEKSDIILIDYWIVKKNKSLERGKLKPRVSLFK